MLPLLQNTEKIKTKFTQKTNPCKPNNNDTQS